MPNMKVLIDDELRFDGPVHGWQLPERPEAFPAALRAEGDPTAPVTPLARLFMLTMFAQVITKTLENPMLQPIDHKLEITAPGSFVLTVTSPPIALEPPTDD